MPVQRSTVFPPIVSSHRIYETAAGTHTDVQPVLSRNQFQSTPGTGQSLNSTNDHLSIDSSAALKRVSIPKFAGIKKHYEAWKAAFYSCVDRARATPEYKLLRLRECLQGEALKVIENLEHCAAAYEAAKSRLERKYGGKRRALTLRLEELEAFKQIREGNEKHLEKFAEPLDALVANLTDAKQEAELGNGSLYITLQRKFNKNLLAKYKQWICDSGTSEDVKALKEFIDRESEFMTAASETIAGVLKDGTKRERTFLTEEDHSFKKKPTKKCKLCREHHGLWKCENFKKMTANERWNVETEHKLCFRCLSDGHRGESCFRSKTCGINGCRSHHHRMLHVEPAPRVNSEEQLRVDPPNALTRVTSGPAREGEPTERTHTTTTGVEPAPSTKFEALRTVPVYLTSGKRKVKVNALLDDGSSKTYLNSDIAAELELEGSPHELTVNVLNDNQEKFETTVVEFTISSLNRRASKLASAYTTEKVTGNMKVVNWRQYQSKWKHLQGIEVPQIGPRTTVDLLIGVDQGDLLYSLKDVKGRPEEPIARLTSLGKLGIGNPDGKAERIQANFTFFLNDSDKVSSLVRRYWDIEQPTDLKTYIVNPDEKLAVDTVANSLTFVDGHYTVGMPWKSDKRLLPDNYSMALHGLPKH